MAQQGLRLKCGALQGMTHKKIADGEVVEIPLQKSPDSVAWRVDDGLFMHVETGVNDGWNTAQSIVFLDDKYLHKNIFISYP